MLELLPDFASECGQARLCRMAQLIIKLCKLLGRGRQYAHRTLHQGLAGLRHFLADIAGKPSKRRRINLSFDLGGLLNDRRLQSRGFVQIMVAFDFHRRGRNRKFVSLCGSHRPYSSIEASIALRIENPGKTT